MNGIRNHVFAVGSSNNCSQEEECYGGVRFAGHPLTDGHHHKVYCLEISGLLEVLTILSPLA